MKYVKVKYSGEPLNYIQAEEVRIAVESNTLFYLDLTLKSAETKGNTFIYELDEPYMGDRIGKFIDACKIDLHLLIKNVTIKCQ